MHRHLLTRRAIRLMQRGLPLPLDLYVALLEYGVDVNELDRLNRP